MIVVVFVGLAIAALCAGIRMLRGPSLADRVVALDVALVTLMCGVAAAAAHTGERTYLSLLVVVAIVGFTATVAASRFVESESEAS